MKMPHLRFHLSVLLLLAVPVASPGLAQNAAPARENAWAPRHEPIAEPRLIARGDREVLTFETEAEVRKLDELFAASQAAVPKPEEFVMNYLRSRTDDSVQPYGLWLPRDYSAGRKFALLIQLHGIGPKSFAGRRTTWRGMGVQEWIDPNAPVIVANPYGRGNSFYQGIGEEDVLEVIADVQRRYAVDADRIFIMGHSMGGAGSWMVGLHYPDRFGSITPIDAAMGFDDGVAHPESLPAWMQPQVAMFKQDNLFPNAKNLPVYLKNAGAGIQKTSTKYSDGVVAEGGFATMESFPGMPHHFAPQISYSIFTGEATVHPIQRQPAEVKFFTNTLRYDRAYWVTFDRLVQHNADARIKAVYDDGKPQLRPAGGPGRRESREPEPARTQSLVVTTENLDAITLRLADAGVPADAALRLTVDGTDVASAVLPAVVHLVKQEEKWELAPAAAHSRKRHGVQGPIGDAFNSRFLVVYGEGDLPLARAELDAIRNPPGRLVIQGEFPLKAAARVTPADIADCNLVLFGTAKTNPVIARLASSLPSSLMKATEEGSALVFIFPNPENPDHYVVIWTGPVLTAKLDVKIEAGWMQPLNLLPDYLVTKDGKIASAGHFDRDWR